MSHFVRPLGNTEDHLRLVVSDNEFKMKPVVIVPKKCAAAALQSQNRQRVEFYEGCHLARGVKRKMKV